jgi:hypothetical protein
MMKRLEWCGVAETPADLFFVVQWKQPDWEA